MSNLSQYYGTVVQLLKANCHSILGQYVSTERLDDDVTDHDNWNGGIDFYRVILYLPVSEFISMKKKHSKEEAERELVDAFKDSIGNEESIQVVCGEIKPKDELESRMSIDASFWTSGYFRLFISHLSTRKVSAVNLKKTLSPFGICGFVAHEDIKPSREWQEEIEIGLNSMDALCAIIEPGFSKSDWCDQEVGWAMGRKVLCIPISIAGQLPYGFFGKVQAIKTQKGMKAREVSKRIFEAICNNPKSREHYLSLLSELLLHSISSQLAEQWIGVFNMIPNLQSSDMKYVYQHLNENAVLLNPAILASLNKLFVTVGLDSFHATSISDSAAVEVDDLPF